MKNYNILPLDKTKIGLDNLFFK